MPTKEKLNSSIHQKISKAEFVNVEDVDTKRFKYNLSLRMSRYYQKYLPKLQKGVNIFNHFCKTNFDLIDYKKVFMVSCLFMAEAFIEGLGFNFALHYILGVKMNPLTIIAWGIGIKQSLSIHKRLKEHGTTNKIPEKN